MVSGTMLAGVRVPSDAFSFYLEITFCREGSATGAFLQVERGKAFLRAGKVSIEEILGSRLPKISDYANAPTTE